MQSRMLEASCSFEREGEKRLPFSELKMVPSSQDSNIEALVSDQERFVLYNCSNIYLYYFAYCPFPILWLLSNPFLNIIFAA